MNPETMKSRSRGFSTDMSGEAIAKRLDIVSGLRELGVAMKESRIIGPVPSCEERAEKEIERNPPATGAWSPGT